MVYQLRSHGVTSPKEHTTQCYFLLMGGLVGFLLTIHFFFVSFTLSLLSSSEINVGISSVSMGAPLSFFCCTSFSFSCFSTLVIQPAFTSFCYFSSISLASLASLPWSSDLPSKVSAFSVPFPWLLFLSSLP